MRAQQGVDYRVLLVTTTVFSRSISSSIIFSDSSACLMLSETEVIAFCMIVSRMLIYDDRNGDDGHKRYRTERNKDFPLNTSPR